MEYSKRKLFVSILLIIGVLILTIGASFAFYSYTRRGDESSFAVGRIYFNSTEDNTIELQNIFPINRTRLATDVNNHDTVTINITGDTTYRYGIEYRVTLVDVDNEINGKKVPITFNVTSTNLGTESNNYWNDRGSDTNVYNITTHVEAEEGKYVLVGYIKPDSVGVNGSIDITAYVDDSRVAISDSIEDGLIQVNNYNNGTDNSWILGREVFTTEEWNSFFSEPLSFKVLVEANEGIWVEKEEHLTLANLNTMNEWKSIRGDITSIEFSTNSEVPNNAITSFDATDITSSGPVTVYTVDDGLGTNTYKAVVCGNGEIYAPEYIFELFSNMPKLETFNSKNFRVDNSKGLILMFKNDISLKNIDTLSSWNLSNIDSLIGLFSGCLSLSNIHALANWDVSNVTSIQSLFASCESLTDISPLANWDTGNVLVMGQLFNYCTNLTDVSPLANWDTKNVFNMAGMFTHVPLPSYEVFSEWDVSNVTSFNLMFFQKIETSTVTSLAGLEDWDVSSATDMHGMFVSNVKLQDASAINNWNINSNIDFTDMFKNTPVHPTFTKVTGVWDSGGTFNMYDELSYISTSGTQYINTKVLSGNSNLSFEIRYEWIEIPTGYAYIFGTYVNEDTDMTRLLQYKSNTTYANVNARASGTMGYTGERTLNTVYTDTLSRLRYETNGTPITRASAPNGTANSKNIFLFRANGSTASSKLKLYYFKIYDNGTLIRDFVPAKTKGTNVTSTLGLVDKVNSDFYGNSGTGEFGEPS